MIALVKGVIVSVEEQAILVDTGNIAYRIYCNRVYEFSVGETISLHTHQHIREDIHLLMGFKEQQSLDLFNLLLMVKGIGAKTALNILEKTQTSDLIEAVCNHNTAFLCTLNGVGKKMASQIILDLENKMLPLRSVPMNSIVGDVQHVLKGLGYKDFEIGFSDQEKKSFMSLPLDEALKCALSIMSKNAGERL